MEKRVVIVGGGFGGLEAAKSLGSRPGIQVALLDKRNHHLFQPLLYQVATALLSPSDIGQPIRQVLARHRNIQVHMESVVGLDLDARQVRTESDVHPYDYLVLACGATHSYFGHDWEELAPGLKTIEQALEIRRRILLAFERAEKESDLDRQRKLLTFVIVGGGPTGVELAGALAELAHNVVHEEFRNIKQDARIILVQGGDRLLPSFPPSLSAKAKLALERKGVRVLLNSQARDISPQGVSMDGHLVESSTVLWAAGVKPSPLNALLGAPLDREGRVTVARDLSLPGRPEVFVVGDQARFETPRGPLPGLAPVAMQEGRVAARNILRDLAGEARKPFRYHDKGNVAVIGRGYAVADVHKLHLSGYPAWVIWVFVHIAYLIGHRNKVVVLLNWAWSYFTFKGGARLITTQAWRETARGPGQDGGGPDGAGAEQPLIGKTENQPI